MKLHTWAGTMALAAMTASAALLSAAAKADSPRDASPAEVKRLVSQLSHRQQGTAEAGRDRAAGNPGRPRRRRRHHADDFPRAGPGGETPRRQVLPEGRLLGQTRCRSEGRRGQPVAQTVLGLKDLPNFTHETIVAKADPAMKRLRNVLISAMQFEGTGTGDLGASNILDRYLWGPAVDQLMADEQVILHRVRCQLVGGVN